MSIRCALRRSAYGSSQRAEAPPRLPVTSLAVATSCTVCCPRLMKRSLPVPMFAWALPLMVGACGPAGSPRLEGKWLGTKTEGIDAAQQTTADDFARQTVLEFRGNAVAIRTPKGVEMGHYKVISTDKDALTIVTDKDGDDEAHTFVFDPANAKTMRWKILPQRTIVLAKQ